MFFTSCQAPWYSSDAAAAPPLLTAAVEATHEAEQRLPREQEGPQGRPGREGPGAQLQQGAGFILHHCPALLPGLFQLRAPTALVVRAAAPPPRRRQTFERKLPGIHRPRDSSGFAGEEEEEERKRESPRRHHDGCCRSEAAARPPALYAYVPVLAHLSDPALLLLSLFSSNLAPAAFFKCACIMRRPEEPAGPPLPHGPLMTLNDFRDIYSSSPTVSINKVFMKGSKRTPPPHTHTPKLRSRNELTEGCDELVKRG